MRRKGILEKCYRATASRRVLGDTESACACRAVDLVTVPNCPSLAFRRGRGRLATLVAFSAWIPSGQFAGRNVLCGHQSFPLWLGLRIVVAGHVVTVGERITSDTQRFDQPHKRGCKRQPFSLLVTAYRRYRNLRSFGQVVLSEFRPDSFPQLFQLFRELHGNSL